LFHEGTVTSQLSVVFSL